MMFIIHGGVTCMFYDANSCTCVYAIYSFQNPVSCIFVLLSCIISFICRAFLILHTCM